MPTIEEKPDALDNPYGVRCAKCTAVLYAEGWNIAAYPTGREQAAYLNQVADAHGWGYGQDFIDGEYKAYYLCPTHLKTSEEAMARLLPRYSERSLCSACGYTDVGTKHCHGRVATCELGAPRNHLHRTCERCGNAWIEGRLDDEKVSTK